MNRNNTKLDLHRYLIIAGLIFAGEMIFSLPFHVPRFFRPTLLQVFDLNNANLGDLFAVYGITAMLAYFPGGIIADRISPRKLMSISLLATAIGGVYMATIPGRMGMSVLFAYWGITSILLFWAAMLRVTREWGGKRSQGKAFGLLDGGRGLVAAVVASIAVLLLGSFFPLAADEITMLQRRHALQAVIIFYTIATLVAALLVWLLIPADSSNSQDSKEHLFKGIKTVVDQHAIWWQALIVVCAYCAYKGLDNYALYAVDVLGMNEVDAAKFTASASYLRPFAAIMAGVLADRWLTSRVLSITFLVLLLCYIFLSLISPAPMLTNLIYANLIISFAAVFALRGIYFALFEEMRLSKQITGTAVGLVSVIGFTPDIFFASIGGRLLDATPGVAGHQHFFLFLTAFALAGLIASIMLSRYHQASRLSAPLE